MQLTHTHSLTHSLTHTHTHARMRAHTYTHTHTHSPVLLFYYRCNDHTTHIHTHRLQCPVSLETVEDGDHRLSRPQDLKLIEDVVLKIFDPQKNEASRADSSSELDDDDWCELEAKMILYNVLYI